MIDESYFNPDQPVGETVKLHHSICSKGKGKALAITRTNTGWLYICHRCGVKGMKTIKGMTPQKTLKFVESLMHYVEVLPEGLQLPEDYTTDLPTEAQTYLLRYMIPHDFDYYRVVYSASYNRVIFPVFVDGTMVRWTGRYLGTVDRMHTKWFTKGIRGRKHDYFKVVDRHTDSTTLVLVEDILSAIVVGRVEHCYALLGTYLPDEFIYNLPYQYKAVFIWLDNDALHKALGMRNRFQQMGIYAKVIHSQGDPKSYTKKEIKRRLQG